PASQRTTAHTWRPSGSTFTSPTAPISLPPGRVAQSSTRRYPVGPLWAITGGGATLAASTTTNDDVTAALPPRARNRPGEEGIFSMLDPGSGFVFGVCVRRWGAVRSRRWLEDH